MAHLFDKKGCTGCAACMSACVHDAIAFHHDCFGFAYPEIDVNRCVDCKACERSCPMMNKMEYKTPGKCIACHVKDESERMKSSSGGLGTLLARYFVEHQGVVYGCAFVVPMRVKHMRCTNLDDIAKLRGSKYVQSDVTEILPQIKEDLCSGKEVLFIGTPCQVAGVKLRFRKYSNLTAVDLICHGVPSFQFLHDTLPKTIPEKQVDKLVFRSCNRFHFQLIGDDKVLFERPIYKDKFLKGFFTGLLFRPSCYTCKYARKERVSDITIADFWKLRSEKIDDAEGKGVSMALLNTDKGTKLFDRIKDNLVYEEHPLQEACDGNEQLNNPFHKTFREKIFKCLYPRFGFSAALLFAVPDRLLGTKLKHILKK